MFWSLTDSGLYKWLKEFLEMAPRGHYWRLTWCVTFFALVIPLTGAIIAAELGWGLLCGLFKNDKEKHRAGTDN
jgi:hypothetical protein